FQQIGQGDVTPSGNKGVGGVPVVVRVPALEPEAMLGLFGDTPPFRYLQHQRSEGHLVGLFTKGGLLLSDNLHGVKTYSDQGEENQPVQGMVEENIHNGSRLQ